MASTGSKSTFFLVGLLDLLFDFFVSGSVSERSSFGGSWMGGPSPTRMSPAVTERGAKGPIRRERASHKKIDPKGSMEK